jgi:hypothetical protein
MFEHIDMLSIGIQQQPYKVLPTLLGSDYEVLGHLWSQHDVIMSRLRLTADSHLKLMSTSTLHIYKPIGAAPRWHFFVGGGGGVWAKKFVTLHGLRISEKKEILRKPTVL